jgi:hypothetical protein
MLRRSVSIAPKSRPCPEHAPNARCWLGGAAGAEVGAIYETVLLGFSGAGTGAAETESALERDAGCDDNGLSFAQFGSGHAQDCAAALLENGGVRGGTPICAGTRGSSRGSSTRGQRRSDRGGRAWAAWGSGRGWSAVSSRRALVGVSDALHDVRPSVARTGTRAAPPGSSPPSRPRSRRRRRAGA